MLHIVSWVCLRFVEFVSYFAFFFLFGGKGNLLWLVRVEEYLGGGGDELGMGLAVRLQETSKVLTWVFRPHDFVEVRIHRWLRTCIDCKSLVSVKG